MKKKSLIMLILFFCVLNLQAQEKTKASFSKKEAQQFSEIYQFKIDNAFDVVSIMKKNASKINISEKRMTEILQAQFAGRELKISSEEQLELNKFQELMKSDELIHNKKVDAFIKTKKLSPSKYLELEKRFQKNNQLRESVSKKLAKN